MWKGIYYKERYLPFSLSTAPFLFNLFTEAFHWILQSHLHTQFILHYLDDFIFALPTLVAPSALPNFTTGYNVKTATEVGVRAIQDHKVIEWNTCWKCRLSEGTDDI